LLREYVVEWQASAPSATTAAFYAYTVAAVWLIARYRGLLTVFERAALVLTLVAGLLAVRSILWFALAALILLPSLLDRTLRRLPTLPHASPFKRGVAGAAIVCVAATATVVATREESWFQQEWPAAAAQRAAAAARAPHVDVISDERYADWLLWEHPELAGRVAFGIRFELFNAGQFETLAAYKRATDAGWDRAAREYGVLVLDRRARTADAEAVLTRRGYNVAYRDRDVAVLVERNATQ
jgi:hypothetical protein